MEYIKSTKGNWCGLWTNNSLFNFKIILILTLIELMIAFSPVGFIIISPFSITTLHIMIIVAAMWSGPVGGVILGTVCGLCVLWKAEVIALNDVDLLFAPFKNGTIVNGLLLSIWSNILYGIIVGFIFILFFKIVKKHRIFFIPFLAVFLDRLHVSIVLHFMDVLFHFKGVSILTAFKDFFLPCNFFLYSVSILTVTFFYKLFNSKLHQNYYSSWIEIRKLKSKRGNYIILTTILMILFVISLLYHTSIRIDLVYKIENIDINREVNFRMLNVLFQYFVSISAAFLLILDSCTMFIKKDEYLKLKKEKEIKEQLSQAFYELKNANETKTIFLNDISHDMRTPLNGIIGLIEICDKHPNNIELLKENRKKAKEAATNLLTLVNDVLEMNKLEDVHTTLVNEPFNLRELITEILTITKLRASENGLNLIHDNGKNLDIVNLMGSPIHIRRILLNILNNAIKFNRINGAINCTSTLVRKDIDTVTYNFVVSDTGIGMSEEFVGHIFEPFSQERSDNRSSYKGSGLGLSIVKALIDKMGGSIAVKSKLGYGSSVSFTIPFKINRSPNQDYLLQKKSISVSGLRILLVEDNELNMEIAKCLLEESGVEVTCAVNGKEAVEIFVKNETGSFDAILMDIMMPVMNGYDASKQIRLSENRDSGVIPIIAMSANAFAEDIEKAKKAGMNEHLSKPLDIENLFKTLGRLCVK